MATDYAPPTWIRLDEHSAGEVVLLVLAEMERTLRRDLTPEEAQRAWVEGWRRIGAAGLGVGFASLN